MLRWQTMVGVLLGLLAGSAILALTGGQVRGPAPAGPILSECDGHLRELVLHYVPAARDVVVPVYRGFLGSLGSDTYVRVVCADEAAFKDFCAAVGKLRCHVTPILVRHPITAWSRDRWVALAPSQSGSATTLWSPRGEAGDEVWPARAGDERVGQDIASALKPAVAARRSALFFDGGDFLADGETVFVVPRVLQRNLQHTVNSREEFLAALSREFKRRIVLLDEAPDHHAGMFMVSVGNKTVLVGDPSLARQVSGLNIQHPTSNIQHPMSPEAYAIGCSMLDVRCSMFGILNSLPDGPDFTSSTQHRFDAVAAQCAAAGYRVIRIPVVPARDGRTYLTYVNVLLDQQGGRRIVYLPFYRGAEALNAAARAVWENLGYEIRPVDCTTAFRHFGCLHCLVNVLQRS